MRKIAVSAFMHINSTIKLIFWTNKRKNLNNNIITDTIFCDNNNGIMNKLDKSSLRHLMQCLGR